MLASTARALDAQDPLAGFAREHFEMPPDKVYLCGNSLGLLPRATRGAVRTHLDKWARLGVEGHFASPEPWVDIDGSCVDSMARVVGAKPSEIAIMNSLTVNVQLLLQTFFSPSPPHRTKVLIEARAFPSDVYAVSSHVASRGLDPSTCVLHVDHEDVLQTIEARAQEICLVFLSGVHYYTGRVFDMERIARTCRDRGICVGFDLAHAAGNVPLHLNKWGVDFAAWCTYKYLNAGPGGIACIFVNEAHHHHPHPRRLTGWWGSDASTRFQMLPTYTPAQGARAWQMSNPPVLQMVCLRASLDVFDAVSMETLSRKSHQLTAFLEECLKHYLPANSWSCLTPPPPFRGCQLSIVFAQPIVGIVYDRLQHRGFVCDKREPDVLRLAPVPLYNSFEDVRRFAQAVAECMPSNGAL